MRVSPVLTVALAALALGGVPAVAASEKSSPPKAQAPHPPVTLDDLFGRLRGAQDEGEAKGIANLIERRFARSGSDTADLLSTRAGEALTGKDYPLAVELLDRVVVLQPRWAEAWNRRAVAFYLLDDHAGAIADLHRAITIEPRHFEAWALLGRVYLANGDKSRALEAFRKALALHPRQDKLREMADRLVPDIDGRDL